MDEDEENLCPYGTPLEPLEEDEIPSKKPIAIEDQVVTDSHGRRRFHGAFTGGFSAGFWNTVGSLEGWKPQSFKSSRSEKAKQQEQKPTDFMDDEDLGEFGIAPQRIQTTDDFTPQEVIDKNIRKRKLQQSSGPIPGVPVLHNLLMPAKENVAIRLLKKMGWKEGQGIGARQTRKEKKITSERNARERYVVKKYGCDLGPLSEQRKNESDESEESSEDDDDDIENITFAPDDFDPYVCAIKDNTFGLGYKGLDSNLLSGKQRHIDLFGNTLEILGKDNRKLSIRGQAFGVGALEEEDEDIYAPDDMTKYDFSLEEKKKGKTRKEKKPSEFCIEGFCSAKKNPNSNKKVFIVKLPPGFKPRNWAIRKSRFEPLSEQQMQLLKQQDEYKTKGLGRHDLDPKQRGNILNETSASISTSITQEKDSKTTYHHKINEKYEPKVDEHKTDKNDTVDNDNSIVLDEDTRKENEKVQNEAKKITQSINTKPGIFKPFINNEAKQIRYEKFLEANLKDEEEIKKFLKSIQPLSMSEWDCELEKKEFLQARNIYKPLTGLMSDRFVSETTIVAEKEKKKEETSSTNNEKVDVERTKTTWKPCAQLCKRFNVVEPFGGAIIEEKKEKKPKISVFDYLEMSVNKKDNFITPVIVPKKIEKPIPIIPQSFEENKKQEINFIDPNKTSTSRDVDEKSENLKSIQELSIASKVDESEKNVCREIKQKSQKPKTELERKIEETKDKHPSEKKDIFKSIFEDSDDEEETEEKDTESRIQSGENNESSTKSVSDASNIPKDIYATLTKSATELNILRNTSPPRGIFASLFVKKSQDNVLEIQKDNQTKNLNDNGQNTSPSTSIETKILAKVSEIKSSDTVPKEDDSSDLQYGPKLPSNCNETSFRNKTEDKNIVSSEDSSSDSVDNLDEKLLKALKKSKSKSNVKKSKIIEEWVEKSEIKSDEKKKKKKDKKKKKSKKHKKEKKSKK